MVLPNGDSRESRSPENLYVWSPDSNRKYIKIEHPPVDREGNPLDLANGIRYEDQLEVVFVITGKAFIPDFPYDYGRFLIVRASAFSRFDSLDFSGVQIIEGALVTEGGLFVEEVKWLNVLVKAPVMDQSRSHFRIVDGLLRDVTYYSINCSKVPAVDMFRCADTRQVVVSKNTVDTIKANGLQGAVFSPLEGSQWP